MRLAAILLSFPALMPLPVVVQPVPGAFRIDANFIVDTVGPANARVAPEAQPEKALEMVDKAMELSAGGPLGDFPTTGTIA